MKNMKQLVTFLLSNLPQWVSTYVWEILKKYREEKNTEYSLEDYFAKKMKKFFKNCLKSYRHGEEDETNLAKCLSFSRCFPVLSTACRYGSSSIVLHVLKNTPDPTCKGKGEQFPLETAGERIELKDVIIPIIKKIIAPHQNKKEALVALYHQVKDKFSQDSKANVASKIIELFYRSNCRQGELDLTQNPFGDDYLVPFLRNILQTYHLTSLKLTSTSNEGLKRFLTALPQQQPPLKIYVENKELLRDDYIAQTPASELINVFDNASIYLYPFQVEIISLTILKFISKNYLTSRDLINTVMQIISKEKSPYSKDFAEFLISCMLSHNLVKNFCLALSNYCKDEDIESFKKYFKQDQLKSVYQRLCFMADRKQISLDEGNQLLKHFNGFKIELYIKYKEEYIPFSFERLGLSLLGLKEFQRLLDPALNLQKCPVLWNPRILGYLHQYVTSGKVDLRKATIDEFLTLYKKFKEESKFKEFLKAAINQEICIKLRPYTHRDKIDEFLTLTEIIPFITSINLEKINLYSGLAYDLVSKLKKLKQVQLTEDSRIPLGFSQLLASKGIQISYSKKKSL